MSDEATGHPSDPLFRLQQDFKTHGDLFQDLAEEVLRSGVTRYPVLVATLQLLSLGVPAPVGRKDGAFFDYRVSFAEELIHKGVITPDRKEAFKLQHRNALGRACVLLVLEKDYQFVFMPYDYSDAPDLAQDIQ